MPPWPARHGDVDFPALRPRSVHPEDLGREERSFFPPVPAILKHVLRRSVLGDESGDLGVEGVTPLAAPRISFTGVGLVRSTP
jgi:hypothetical protein